MPNKLSCTHNLYPISYAASPKSTWMSYPRRFTQQKKSRMSPSGNALPYIDSFFEPGASLGAHPFSFEKAMVQSFYIPKILHPLFAFYCPLRYTRAKP